MLRKGTATGYKDSDLSAMFEECISNMSMDDLRLCKQDKVTDTDTGLDTVPYVITYATNDECYYTFRLTRTLLNPATVVYSVVNEETNCEILTVTCVGSSWTCNRGAITRSRTVNVLQTIYEAL